MPRSGQSLAATGHILWHGAEGGDSIPQARPGVRVRAGAASTVPIVLGDARAAVVKCLSKEGNNQIRDNFLAISVALLRFPSTPP